MSTNKQELARKRNWILYLLRGGNPLKISMDGTILTEEEIKIITRIKNLNNILIRNFSKNNKLKGLSK